MSNFRIGHGYDVHRLTDGRDLILGGVKIDYPLGLMGHSDADVLVHSVMDAIIGALALGDIGKHFPDNDEKYKGISSIVLLCKVKDLMVERGYSILNIDVTVVAERPKLAPYIDAMRQCLAEALGTGVENVNIKATTEEKLGFTGRGEGISAHAVALLVCP